MNTYLADQSAADIEAYFKALQTVNGKEGELLKDLDNANLFTESGAIQDLLNMMGG